MFPSTTTDCDPSFITASYGICVFSCFLITQFVSSSTCTPIMAIERGDDVQPGPASGIKRGADTTALFVLLFALERRPGTQSGCITWKKSFVCKQKTQKEVPWCSGTVCAHSALSCSRSSELIIILLWSPFHQWETLRGGARVSLIYTRVTILLPLFHTHTHTHLQIIMPRFFHKLNWGHDRDGWTTQITSTQDEDERQRCGESSKMPSDKNTNVSVSNTSAVLDRKWNLFVFFRIK